MAAPEQEWLDQYRQGHIEALGKLVEHYRRPLYAFILRMTEGREDSEEIFQEVWLRVIRNMDRYRHKSFLSWLFRIAHNLVIDRARRQRPQVSLEARASPEDRTLEERIPSPGLGPAERVDGQDLGRRITDAVGRLPLEQREVFLLRTEADLPFKEIAAIQKCSINTALARMQYALGKLRQDLQEEYAALKGGG